MLVRVIPIMMVLLVAIRAIGYQVCERVVRGGG